MAKLGLDFHAEAMGWLRFVKQYPIVCTEAGRWNADVLGVSAKSSTEIEVKKTRSDFLADFRKKQQKHEVYANAKQYVHQGQAVVPNYFYFLVPPEMAESSIKTIEESAPYAGLCVFNPALRGRLPGDRVVFHRKAPRLHAGKPTPILIRNATRRMASELTMTRNKHTLAPDTLTWSQSTAAANAFSPIDSDGIELDVLASEIQRCVAGKSLWGELDDQSKNEWRAVARRWTDQPEDLERYNEALRK